MNWFQIVVKDFKMAFWLFGAWTTFINPLKCCCGHESSDCRKVSVPSAIRGARSSILTHACKRRPWWKAGIAGTGNTGTHKNAFSALLLNAISNSLKSVSDPRDVSIRAKHVTLWLLMTLCTYDTCIHVLDECMLYTLYILTYEAYAQVESEFCEVFLPT